MNKNYPPRSPFLVQGCKSRLLTRVPSHKGLSTRGSQLLLLRTTNHSAQVVHNVQNLNAKHCNCILTIFTRRLTVPLQHGTCALLTSPAWQWRTWCHKYIRQNKAAGRNPGFTKHKLPPGMRQVKSKNTWSVNSKFKNQHSLSSGYEMQLVRSTCGSFYAGCVFRSSSTDTDIFSCSLMSDERQAFESLKNVLVSTSAP